MKKGTKTMNMKMVAALALVGTGVAFADVGVTGVKVQPRSPWNGLVDIEYTIACDDPNADIYINPTVYDGDRRITLFPSAFTGDGATNTVKAGKHKLVWDAMKDLGAFSCANFQFKIYAGKRLAPYVKIDLSSGCNSSNYPVTLSCVGPDVTKDECRTSELWLRLVPPGEFWMGSHENEVGRTDTEVLHHVTFTKPFYIGVFEVTQGQFLNVMGSERKAYFCLASDHSLRPMENVGFEYVRGKIDSDDEKSDGSFISELMLRTSHGGIDLPTESQWEYACRAGTMTALNNGKNISPASTFGDGTVDEVAAYYGNRYAGKSYSSGSVDVGTQTVGRHVPNALGLYDMHGNVAELCLDTVYGDRKGNSISGNTHIWTWEAKDIIDPGRMCVFNSTSYTSNQGDWYSVVRGGSWQNKPAEIRSAYRADYRQTGSRINNTQVSSTLSGKDTIGFRICAEVGF